MAPSQKSGAPRRKKPSVEEELAELRTLAEDPRTPEALARFQSTIAGSTSHPVAKVARIIKDAALESLARPLAGAFERFMQNAVKSDPGCNAKLAIVEALDALGYDDPAPFERAREHVQLEGAWGPPVDTAAMLRAGAIRALAHSGHTDFLLMAGEMLADPEVPVRLAAAEALAHRGDRNGAALLLPAARRGDEDPVVHTAYLSGLLALAPGWGLPRLERLLAGTDASLTELAAIALGESGLEEALTLLLDYVEKTPLARDRIPAIRALGLHRSDRALEALATMLAEGSRTDAETVLKALAPRRFDARVRTRLASAVAINESREVAAMFRDLFED